jgi:hypothetical protein
MQALHGKKIDAECLRSHGKSEFHGHTRTNHHVKKKTMENVRGQEAQIDYPLFLTACRKPS